MPAQIVLLDNTVLTNFALVGRPNLVFDIYGRDCATTTAVMAEYQAGVISRGLPAHTWNDLTELVLNSAEQALANQLAPQLGKGERSCIAIAVYQQGLFVCDDADARREARQRGVKVTGTIGILVLNVRRGNVTLSDGNALLANMIAEGYRSPVVNLDDLV